MMRIAKREKGITVVGAILLLGIIGFMVYVVGFVATPMYLEYYQIRKGMTTIAEDINNYNMSIPEIKKRIERHFSLEYTKAYDYRNPVIKKEKGTIYVSIVYEDKRKIFKNLFMVLDVNENAQLYP